MHLFFWFDTIWHIRQFFLLILEELQAKKGLEIFRLLQTSRNDNWAWVLYGVNRGRRNIFCLIFSFFRSRLQELAEISSIQQDDSSSGQDNEESVTIIQANGIFLSSSFKRILNALQQNSAAEWSVISTNPTAGSLFLMQHSKMKAKIFDLSSRAVVVFRDAVFTRSKRG